MTPDQWQIASAISTIVQAIVVVVSLYFIWRQVQQQTRQAKQRTELTRAANAQALVGLSSPLNLELIKDPQMARFWIKGAEEYDTYSDVDKYRYRSLLIWWLILHENIFYQRQNDLLDEGIYSSWDSDLKTFIRQQRLHLRWAELKGAFQLEFSNYLEKLIAGETTRIQLGDATSIVGTNPAAT
jgi:hypothetical protein